MAQHKEISVYLTYNIDFDKSRFFSNTIGRQSELQVSVILNALTRSWQRFHSGAHSAAHLKRKDFLHAISLPRVCQFSATISQASLIAFPISILSGPGVTLALN